MKISKNEIGMLAGALGVLVAVLCYTLVYTPYQDKITSMESELITLQQQEAQLLELQANQAFYTSEIDRMTAENSEILDQFPAEVKAEDEIMYVVELEKEVDIEIPSITYGAASPVLASGEEAVEVTEETTEEEVAAITSGDMQLYMIPMNVSYKTTYGGLKDAITYTNNKLDRMYIDTVNVSYDNETGEVTGGMTFNLYYLTGTDKVYESPTVPDIKTGVTNLFNTKD